MPEFAEEVLSRIDANGQSDSLRTAAAAFMRESLRARYSYNFSWLGRPIIQYPQDIVAMQELFWSVQPDLVIETGIAHGGSLIFSASMLELNAACGGDADARVIGIDVDIRRHNRSAIEAHPMSRRITMIEGSSIAQETVMQVKRAADGRKRILVCLDSNHTQDHVLAELVNYAPLTSIGSYCVVFDTIIEEMPEETSEGRPWGLGNNPKTAIRHFLQKHPEFEVDNSFDKKLLLSVAPEGFLRRVA